MKVKSVTIGKSTVRMTKQSEAARYGAGAIIVRTIINRRKHWEKSFGPGNMASAEKEYAASVDFVKRLAAERGEA